MNRLAATLLLLGSFLLIFTQDASGYGKLTPENRVGVFGIDPNITTQIDGPQPVEFDWERVFWGYDYVPDVHVGPNLYTYVRQNPWTAFDPTGLKLESTTEDRDDGGRHTSFKISGVILDSSGDTDRSIDATKDYPELGIKKGDDLVTHEDAVAKMTDSIRSSVKDAFTGEDGNHSWSVEVDLKLVDSARDIKEGDHVFNIIHETKNPIISKSAGIAKFGGTIVNVQDVFAYPGSGTAGHEMGHSAGLLHPWAPKTGYGVDSDNPIRDQSTTPMSYGSGAGGFTSKQVELMQYYHDQGDLNGSQFQTTSGSGGYSQKWNNPAQTPSDIFGRKRFGGDFPGYKGK